MTLREAAARTSRSITTLRRYIRSGRLHAEKHYGRFGPEYFVSERDLAEAGLDREPPAHALELAPAPRHASPLPAAVGAYDPRLLREIVPLALFQELQMKHEQLLVQYGMVRAGGLRAMELRADLEAKQQRLEEAEAAIERLRRGHEDEVTRLRREIREAQFELEGRRLEIDALLAKVRALEMLTRNAVTSETIDQQLRRIHEQARRAGQLPAEADPPAAPPDSRGEDGPTDH